MKRLFEVYAKKKGESSSSSRVEVPQVEVSPHFSNEREKIVDVETLQADPGIRKQIFEFHPDIQDDVRKSYLKKDPHQPRDIDFPWTQFGKVRRRFNPDWYDKYSVGWLEYSVHEDKAYCLPCYLFKNVLGYGGEAFVSVGFKEWNNPVRLSTHVNDNASSHRDCVHKCNDLMNPKQNIGYSLMRNKDQKNIDYRARVTTSLIASKYLLKCGFPFRGDDETEDSPYKGPFRELVETLKENNKDLSDISNSAPKNNTMLSPKIQKSLCAACSFEITAQIISEIGNDVFCVLIDESGDCGGSEQMAVVIRYVDSAGFVKERFLGIVHVKETSAISLKKALVDLLSQNGLSLSRIRGQGYDGASNMKGRLGGLRTLIQNENSSAYYVHCFAHQLQLALVACARTHSGVSNFVGKVNLLVTYIRSSNKRQELLRGKQAKHYKDLIEEGEIETGSGQNQQSGIVRAGDTRWGSHFRTINSLKTLYVPLIGVLNEIGNDSSFQRFGEAEIFLFFLKSFGFIFWLLLLVDVLAITHDLNLTLQRRDQDLLNALYLIKTAKERLQELRNEAWDELLPKVVATCNKVDVVVPDMDAPYVQGKNARRQSSGISNLHHYKHDCLFNVLDLQLEALNSRFDEANTELLQCVGCLSPISSFAAFNVDKLMRMVELYPKDFEDESEVVIRNQLQNYIKVVRCDPDFKELRGLSDLSVQLVKTNKCNTFSLVYKLVKLALLLPVATVSVERVFSAMNHVKCDKSTTMGDQWLNDRLVTYLERDVLSSISNDVILAHFQKFDRRFSL